MTKKDHIPKPGYSAGRHGIAICGRWAHYLTADYHAIRYAAKKHPERFCKHCLK